MGDPARVPYSVRGANAGGKLFGDKLFKIGNLHPALPRNRVRSVRVCVREENVPVINIRDEYGMVAESYYIADVKRVDRLRAVRNLPAARNAHARHGARRITSVYIFCKLVRVAETLRAAVKLDVVFVGRSFSVNGVPEFFKRCLERRLRYRRCRLAF